MDTSTLAGATSTPFLFLCFLGFVESVPVPVAFWDPTASFALLGVGGSSDLRGRPLRRFTGGAAGEIPAASPSISKRPATSSLLVPPELLEKNLSPHRQPKLENWTRKLKNDLPGCNPFPFRFPHFPSLTLRFHFLSASVFPFSRCLLLLLLLPQPS